MKENSRRGFMGKAFGAVAGLGAIGSLVAMKKSWDPLPSVKAAGFTTLDMSIYEEGVMVTEKWRGKPIFVLKKTPEMMKDEEGNPEAQARNIKVGNDNFMIAIGLCTHLGCIPAFRKDKGDFLCACHGGMFSASGLVTKVPPPRGFDIPPFKIDGNKLLLGEVGPEYQAMKDNGVTL
ncbi:ubiquinol-cytochrome c reductase iron-sulfur subunit [Sulfurimonas lithotrophica]|uniref:Ubiquinol-cytochrome c reductase iron-sulfur subunit n=1 Tax=Sulfurimonas lithotrophica TaxID=2590022 RepID=A0A5P8P3B7_9BACT|nr:ubiquinol-cytochrome c reductase iron-sulfur subunit [Sulfurimonas lithotrophica]QFR50253.1 ubiquinol-cytochrome c reductase iron-sulfur subunit [Sulfurimonas lithotrophica]